MHDFQVFGLKLLEILWAGFSSCRLMAPSLWQYRTLEPLSDPIQILPIRPVQMLWEAT